MSERRRNKDTSCRGDVLRSKWHEIAWRSNPLTPSDSQWPLLQRSDTKESLGGTMGDDDPNAYKPSSKTWKIQNSRLVPAALVKGYLTSHATSDDLAFIYQCRVFGLSSVLNNVILNRGPSVLGVKTWLTGFNNLLRYIQGISLRGTDTMYITMKTSFQPHIGLVAPLLNSINVNISYCFPSLVMPYIVFNSLKFFRKMNRAIGDPSRSISQMKHDPNNGNAMLCWHANSALYFKSERACIGQSYQIAGAPRFWSSGWCARDRLRVLVRIL